MLTIELRRRQLIRARACWFAVTLVLLIGMVGPDRDSALYLAVGSIALFALVPLPALVRWRRAKSTGSGRMSTRECDVHLSPGARFLRIFVYACLLLCCLSILSLNLFSTWGSETSASALLGYIVILVMIAAFAISDEALYSRLRREQDQTDARPEHDDQ